jgi:hypothetical protein
MTGKRFWSWMVLLAALAPMGCQSFCDRWAPCHNAPSAYQGYPAGAGCVPCCPQQINPCAPVGYQPTNAYQQGSWAAPQTRLSPNCCD